MRRTLHDLHCRVIPVFEIFRKPHCREVTPPQFLDQHVTVYEHLADVARVVASDFVVLDALVFTVILLVKFGDQFVEGSE